MVGGSWWTCLEALAELEGQWCGKELVVRLEGVGGPVGPAGGVGGPAGGGPDGGPVGPAGGELDGPAGGVGGPAGPGLLVGVQRAVLVAQLGGVGGPAGGVGGEGWRCAGRGNRRLGGRQQAHPLPIQNLGRGLEAGLQFVMVGDRGASYWIWIRIGAARASAHK